MPFGLRESFRTVRPSVRCKVLWKRVVNFLDKTVGVDLSTSVAVFGICHKNLRFYK